MKQVLKTIWGNDFITLNNWQLVCLYIYQIIALIMLPKFDVSTELFITRIQSSKESIYHPFIKSILEGMMSWDSVYILKLSMEGITYEHEWVFAPLLWRFMYKLRVLINTIFQYEMNVYDITLCYFIINCVLLYQICQISKKIVELIIRNDYLKDVSIDSNTINLFTYLRPIGVISLICYSETPAQFFTFYGVYLYLSSFTKSKTFINSKVKYLLSGVMFSVAFGIRSNCLLMGILYLNDLFTLSRKRDKLLSLFTGGILFISFIYLTYLPYFLYCPERGEWCNSTTKSLVSYLQVTRWNNGFLNYFTLNNIPNFIISLPTVLFIALMNVTLWNIKSVRGLVYISWVYLFTQVFFMNIQIITRVSSFLPITIIALSLGVYECEMKENKLVRVLNDSKFISIYLFGTFIWNFIQPMLFGAFLPPA